MAPIPKASIPDTLGVLFNVFLPTILKGVIIRRPRVVALAARFNLDQRAIRQMQKLRGKYGTSPLLLPTPIQPQAVLLNPEDIRNVLENTAEPYAAATQLKRSALAHFEPENVLISQGEDRAERRQFHEAVLDFHRPVHRLAERFVEVVNTEAGALLDEARRRGDLTWEPFIAAWYRMVRTVVFGAGACDDRELTDMLPALRRDANWGFLKPKRTKLRAKFLSRVAEWLHKAEPNSLGGLVAQMPKSANLEPAHQIPQWLFAFDAAAITVFRALALLAAHPDEMANARQEIETDATGRQHLPFLRACIEETLRLYPTTPMILRESTRETVWDNGTLPKRTQILIFAPYFHRDDLSLPYAEHFAPEIWLTGDAPSDPRFVPFSAGAGACPGQHIVRLVSSAMLAALIENRVLQLQPANQLNAAQPLPATLNNYGLRFAVR